MVELIHPAGEMRLLLFLACYTCVSMSRTVLDRSRVKLLGELRTLATTPMMRGSLIERLRVCGRKTCACARDPKRRHPGLHLSVHLDGRTRSIHVRPEDEPRIRRMLAGYERLWAVVNELTACEVAALGEATRARASARQRAARDAA